MRVLSSINASGVLAGARALGLDDSVLARDAGLEGPLDDPRHHITEAAYAALWGGIVAALPRETIVTEVGLAIPVGALGPLDYLALTSPTLGAAVSSFVSHFGVTLRTGVTVSRERVGGALGIGVRTKPGNPFGPFAEEFLIATLAGRFTWASSAHSPVEAVSLSRPHPVDPTAFERLYGAPVQFSNDHSLVRFRATAERAPLRSHDPYLQATMSRLAEHLRVGASSDLVAALQARLRDLLPQGRANAHSAARTLGMSERTLHRRLTELGTTFQDVLSSFRVEEAKALLRSGMLTQDQIAEQLGYATVSTWVRAFRKSVGTPPATWCERTRDGRA